MFLCACLAGAPQLLVSKALAGTPTPYGEYFVRLGETWPDGTVAGKSLPRPVSSSQDTARYEQQLAVLEQAGGPYADTLAEPLADLGRLYRQNGDIQQAQQLYQRALHVVRINEGLYSERQVPILRELFATYRLAGDIATLDGRYDYFFRLYGSGKPPFTPIRLGAALEYLRWQREALRLELDESDTERLLALFNLNQQLLDEVAGNPAVDYARYRELALSQVRNLYLLQERYEPRVEVVGVPSGMGPTSPWTEEEPGQQRLEMFQRTALTRGRAILAELILRTPPEQTRELAAAHLELADWHQWNNRPTDALDGYAQVLAILEEAGEQTLAQQWLGQAVELPANGAFWQARLQADEAAPLVVQAHFDVSAAGRAEHVETTMADSDNASQAGRLRRALAQTRFRPRFSNGEPMPDPGLVRDYQIID